MVSAVAGVVASGKVEVAAVLAVATKEASVSAVALAALEEAVSAMASEEAGAPAVVLAA